MGNDERALKKVEDFDLDKLCAVPIDDIYPLGIEIRVREREIERIKHVIGLERKDLKDVILTVYDKRYDSKKRNEYIIGELIRMDGRFFFKPIYSDELILFASKTSYLTERSNRYTYEVDFNEPLGEIKIVYYSDLHAGQWFYPEDYATSYEMRNLVLNHPLCIDITSGSLKKLTSFEDDGIWEILFNEKFKDDYSKELLKKRLIGQKNLINGYLQADAYYEGLDIEEGKEERKQMIRKLFRDNN